MDEHTDLVEQALGEITSLHREQEKFRAFITAIIRQIQPFMDAAELMLLWRDILQARGDALYKIAEIVGAPPVYVEDLLYIYIGFEGQQYALPMWDETVPTIVGGRWLEFDERELTIDDIYEAQRVVIRAQIMKNQSHGFTPEIQESLSLLFHAPVVFVQNNKDMSFDLNIGSYLTPVEIQLIRDFDILPRPAGVQIRDFMYWDGAKHVFGFEHQTGTFGFDDGYFALRIEVT
jgi:hypothetical protein